MYNILLSIQHPVFCHCCWEWAFVLTHRWQRGMGSISGGWSTLTSRPIVACVRACCSASGSRDSAAPVRGHSHHQGAVVHLIHSTNDRTFSSSLVLSVNLYCSLPISKNRFYLSVECFVLNSIYSNICFSSGCKYTVHSQCANKNPEPCARTFVKSKKEIDVS